MLGALKDNQRAAVKESGIVFIYRKTEIDVKNFNEIDTLVQSALEQVWSGKKTAEEAMTEVKAQTDSLVDGTYSGNRSACHTLPDPVYRP